MSRRIAVVGSRTIADIDNNGDPRSYMERDWMFYHLDKLLYEDNPFVEPVGAVGELRRGTAILSGGSFGVDKRAQEYAEANGIPFFLYKPYHLVDSAARYDPRYFFTRNKQIVDNCDEVIAFWDGTSSGTADTIRFAGKRGKTVVIIKPDDREILEFA